MMNKKWLVISILFIFLGMTVFALSSCSSGIFSVEYTTDEFELTEDFDSILIDVDTADVELALSEDDACHVVVYSHEKIKHSATVDDGKLKVSFSDEREWYDYLVFRTEETEITLYLPKTQYESLVIGTTTGDVDVASSFTFRTAEISLTTGDVEFLASVIGLVKISTTTGDIELSDMSAAAIDIGLTTGDTSLENVVCGGDIFVDIGTGDTCFTNVTCHNLTTDGTTGRVSLVNVIADGKMTLTRTTGDVTFDRSDASELYVDTGTGDVTGTFLTSKIFITNTTTGKIDVPETTVGGVCKINTTTGKIIINIAE